MDTDTCGCCGHTNRDGLRPRRMAGVLDEYGHDMWCAPCVVSVLLHPANGDLRVSVVLSRPAAALSA